MFFLICKCRNILTLKGYTYNVSTSVSFIMAQPPLQRRTLSKGWAGPGILKEKGKEG